MGLGEVCAAANEAVVAAAFANHHAGALDLAEPLYRQALDSNGEDLNALHMLGALLSKRGRALESVDLLERAEEQICSRGAPAAHHAVLCYNLGLAQKSAGRSSDAMVSFRRGLALSADDAPLHAKLAGEIGQLEFLAGDYEQARDTFEQVVKASPDDAQSWFMLGCSWDALRAASEATAAYWRCLACRPDFVGALFRLGLLLRDDQQRPVEAVALLQRAIALAPNDFDLHQALGETCRRVNAVTLALDAFRRAAEIAPDSAAAQFDLGSTLVEAGRNEEAIGPLQRVISIGQPPELIQPATLLLGDALQLSGRTEDAARAFRGAAMIDPVALLRPAAAGARQVLFLFAPGLYNTPYRYLTQGETYGASLLLLVPGLAYDIDTLRLRGDVIVNLVSDADRDRAVLTDAAALVDQLGKPVINHPARIMPTDRERIAVLLAAIPGCRVADTRRYRGGAVLAADFAMPTMPCLVRRAGFHNGEEFEKIAEASELLRFVAGAPGADHYIIDYLDYRSPDGFFRKYRFFFVGSAVYPYHLAIGNDWKVHHVNTDMAGQAWMQQEEAAFLDAPERVFDAAQMACLSHIQDALGLEFAGIDCAIAADGAVVVFEANATMLVHGETTNFPYREPHVLRIKAAFNAMLGP